MQEKKQEQKGFTLVEVMVSLLILLMTATGIFASFIASQNYVMRSKRRIAAVNFVRQKFEELKPYVRQDTWAAGTNLLYAPATSIPQLYPGTFSFSAAWPGNLNYTVTNTDDTVYRAVNLTASWLEPD